MRKSLLAIGAVALCAFVFNTSNLLADDTTGHQDATTGAATGHEATGDAATTDAGAATTKKMTKKEAEEACKDQKANKKAFKDCVKKHMKG